MGLKRTEDVSHVDGHHDPAVLNTLGSEEEEDGRFLARFVQQSVHDDGVFVKLLLLPRVALVQ